MARPVYYRGVPVGNLTAANQVTIPGSLNAVSNYRRAKDTNRGAVIASVATGINREYMPPGLNPYTKAMQLNGLGDGDDQMAPGSSNPTTVPTSGWMNVLDTFVGNISKGIAAKIGGYNPNAPVTIPGTKSVLPSWAPLAMAGVGGFFLLKFLRKRA
jgi:hypothetical protein